jgi:hypothetical protein
MLYRRIILVLCVAICAALLPACGTTEKRDDAAALDGLAVHTPAAAVRQTSMADVLRECVVQVGAIATSASGGEASKVAAAGALERLCGAQAQVLAHGGQQQAPAPQSVAGVLWNGLLQAADLVLRGYGIKAQRDVSIVQSNNQAQTTIASYGAFSTMGGYVRDAGVAGYPYIQAPGAITNTTTTSTLSGTGVLGSGTYTGPVTTSTTRTCSGGGAGAAGNSGGTAGGPGGAGGAGGQASC